MRVDFSTDMRYLNTYDAATVETDERRGHRRSAGTCGRTGMRHGQKDA